MATPPSRSASAAKKKAAGATSAGDGADATRRGGRAKDDDLTRGGPPAKTRGRNKDDEDDGREIPFEKDRKPHQLPERIAKLPKDDPERKRYEKGWKSEDLQHADTMADKARMAWLKLSDLIALQHLLLPLLLVAAVAGGVWYAMEVQHTREEVWRTLKNKGWDEEEPIIQRKFGDMKGSYWLPTLRAFLTMAENLIRRPRILDDFSTPNPTFQNYLRHILDNNLPFDNDEAIRWLSNSYRAPAPERKLVEEKAQPTEGKAKPVEVKPTAEVKKPAPPAPPMGGNYPPPGLGNYPPGMPPPGMGGPPPGFGNYPPGMGGPPPGMPRR